MWDKEWYMNLSCRDKCLVKMVRDKADLCGVWSPNWIIASTYVGEKVTEDILLKINGGEQFKKLDNGKIYCIGFVEFQYGELSEKSPVHKKIIQLLTQNGILDNYKIIGYQYPIDRVQEEDKDKEEEKDKEKEKDSSKKIEKLLIPKMVAEFKNNFPDYPTDQNKDYPALLKIANFIAENSNIPKTMDLAFTDAILPYWQNMCHYIAKDNFFKNYSISQVEKHIQSIVLNIQNGSNNNNGKNKPITAAGLNKAFDKYFGRE